MKKFIYTKIIFDYLRQSQTTKVTQYTRSHARTTNSVELRNAAYLNILLNAN